MFEILSEICDERARQDQKWGVQNHPFSNETIIETSAVLVKLFTQTCEANAASGTLTWYDILAEEFYEAFAETDIDKQIEEMTQVAAVAVATIEALERKKHDIQMGH